MPGLRSAADDEARAQRLGGHVEVGRADVLGPDHAAMGFDDLLGDREAEAGMVAELLDRDARSRSG
jgi:hypothetical protein